MANKNTWKSLPFLLIFHLAFTLLAYFCIFGILKEYFFTIIQNFTKSYKNINIQTIQKLDNFKDFISTLKKHSEKEYALIMIFHIISLLFLHTWSLPGSFLFEISAGFIFGLKIAWPLCIFMNVFGNLLSFSLYSVYRVFNKKNKKIILSLSNFLIKHDILGDLYFYLISIKMALPDFILTLFGPYIGLSCWDFILSTFLASIPWNFMSTICGAYINEFKEFKDLFLNYQNLILVFFNISE